MVELFFSGLLLVFASIFYAIQWKLYFHFSTSVFKNLNGKFWNPEISHFNKWKLSSQTKRHIKDNGKQWWYFGLYTPKYMERFPYSSTILVFLTDAFHLFQFLYKKCWFASMSIMMNIWLIFHVNMDIPWYLLIFILNGIFSSFFEISLRSLDDKKH